MSDKNYKMRKSVFILTLFILVCFCYKIDVLNNNYNKGYKQEKIDSKNVYKNNTIQENTNYIQNSERDRLTK